MRLGAFALCVCLAVTFWFAEATQESDSALFNAFKEKYAKAYNSADEEAHRFACFRETLKLIEQRNQVDNVHGVNELADLCEEEFLSHFTSEMKIPKEIPQVGFGDNYEYPPYTPPPVDWRKQGGVTAVMNQGLCAASYAFAAVDTLIGNARTVGFGLLQLSYEQVIQCSNGYGANLGCKGGDVKDALEWMKVNGGVMYESDYGPYSLKNGVTGTCKNRTFDFPIDYGQWQKSPNATFLEDWIYQEGPVAVAVDVTNWRTYTSGIMKNCTAGKPVLNAAALIVGYDNTMTPPDEPYWILKNYWGSNWGEEGYIRLYLGGDTCGIMTMQYQAHIHGPMRK